VYHWPPTSDVRMKVRINFLASEFFLPNSSETSLCYKIFGQLLIDIMLLNCVISLKCIDILF
jgi:hypothetical protein